MSGSSGTVDISIRDCGPVVEFEYQIDQPGMYVLRGGHGSGKTTILRTVELCTNGRTDVPPTKRDGTNRGEATVAGKTLRIAKQVRTDGDLSVDGLGDLSIADLHTPRFSNEETRDKHRIRTLIRLANVTPTPALFHPLLGDKEKFEQVVSAEATTTDDLVEMAARVKRALEKAAQTRESQQGTAEANMRAQQQIAESVDLGLPHDEQELRERANKAIEHRATIRQQRTHALALIERSKIANSELKQLGTNCRGANELRDHVSQWAQSRKNAEHLVAEAEKELAARRASLQQIITQQEAAERELKQAESMEAMVASWQSDIDAAATVACPTEDEVAKAEVEVMAANAAIETGIKIRQAITAQELAAEYAEEAKTHARAAQRLRDAAHDTHDVLAEAVAKIPNCPLSVKLDDDGNARLVVPARDDEPFDRLSDGERWPLILQIAAASNRLITLSQAAYGELSARTRKQLHDLAVQHGCYILTASIDEGELRCTPYVNEPAEELAAT